MEITITIGGDFCITPEFVSKKKFITDELFDLLKKSDLNIINLECPVLPDNVINVKNRIIKTGPHLNTTIEVFKHLNDFHTNLVTLANNHILDYGDEGLISTIEFCKKNNIQYVGAGVNISDASKPKIIESNDLRIGFVNFCENEWSIASQYGAGANPVDLIENLKQIEYAREKADFVFAIIHGGHEYYSLPSKRMVKMYRFLAEKGADAVIGHHTHCISGYEIHNNVPIFYSLGNMLFTKPNTHNSWYTGLLVQFTLHKNKSLVFELYPIRQSQKDYKLAVLSDKLKEDVLKEVEGYTEIIANEKEMERQWKLFIESKNRTINVFSPINAIPGSYFRAVLRRLGLNRILLTKKYLAQIYNHIRCEAHLDTVINLLDQNIKK